MVPGSTYVKARSGVCSNQFLNQEPGSNDEIKNFASGKGFKGLLMDKIDVNGPGASPVYAFLKVGVLVTVLCTISLQPQHHCHSEVNCHSEPNCHCELKTFEPQCCAHSHFKLSITAILKQRENKKTQYRAQHHSNLSIIAILQPKCLFTLCQILGATVKSGCYACIWRHFVACPWW